MANILGIKDDKKIHVNTASIVDLKAALFSKRNEAAREKRKQQDDGLVTRKVSDKTSSIWRNRVGPGRKPKKMRNSATASEEKDKARSQQEDEEWEKSRQALLTKAAEYERLSKGQGLRELEHNEEDGSGDEGSHLYMVDFTKKLYQARFNKEVPDGDQQESCLVDEKKGVASGGEEEEGPIEGQGTEKEEEEWVEYVDSLGRSRRCLKEDLSQMMERDKEMAASAKRTKRSPTPDLLSEDMRMERERRQWEMEAEEEVDLDKPVEPIHYQSVQGGEVRSHGVGYFAFDTDVEKRKEQMDLLDKLRQQTFTQREKRQQVLGKRKALLDARLAKVRQRKLKQQQEEGIDQTQTTENLTDFNFEDTEKKNTTEGESSSSSEISVLLANEMSRAQENARLEQERKEEGKRAAHLRPWDRGKVVDPIKKRKKELEDERPSEFAPPSFYSRSKGIEKKSSSSESESKLYQHEDIPQPHNPASAESVTTEQSSTLPTYSLPPPPPPLPFFPPSYAPGVPPSGAVPVFVVPPHPPFPFPLAPGGVPYPAPYGSQYFGYPPPPTTVNQQQTSELPTQHKQ